MTGLLILIILASLLYSFNFYARRRKKLINYFNSKWGKEITKTSTDTDFENIKTYWELKSNAQNQQMPTGYIDELTWHDLDMDQVFLKINNTESIIGESYLYDRLHHLSFDQEELSHFEDLVDFMTKNESARLKIQLILNKFGKGMWNRIPSYLFKINEKNSYYKPLYSVIGLFPILCCLGLFIDFKIGLILVCTAIACNAYIHYQHANAIAYEMDALNAIHPPLCIS